MVNVPLTNESPWLQSFSLPPHFSSEYPGMCAFFVSLLYTVSFLTECVCVLRNFVHGDVTCPGRPTGWTIGVTSSCYTPTPTPLGGQSYVKLSTQWGGHVTAHCPPSGMANITKHCPPSGMDGESNGENVGENLNHSFGVNDVTPSSKSTWPKGRGPSGILQEKKGTEHTTAARVITQKV